MDVLWDNSSAVWIRVVAINLLNRAFLTSVFEINRSFLYHPTANGFEIVERCFND